MPKCIRPRNPRLFWSQSLESYGNKERKGCKSTIISIKKRTNGSCLERVGSQGLVSRTSSGSIEYPGRASLLSCKRILSRSIRLWIGVTEKTYQYLPHNGLPYHPLEGVGYDSLGDWHNTKKISEVDSVEDTRHGGHGRGGLHLELPEGLTSMCNFYDPARR